MFFTLCPRIEDHEYIRKWTVFEEVQRPSERQWNFRVSVSPGYPWSHLSRLISRIDSIYDAIAASTTRSVPEKQSVQISVIADNDKFVRTELPCAYVNFRLPSQMVILFKVRQLGLLYMRDRLAVIASRVGHSVIGLAHSLTAARNRLWVVAPSTLTGHQQEPMRQQQWVRCPARSDSSM